MPAPETLAAEAAPRAALSAFEARLRHWLGWHRRLGPRGQVVLVVAVGTLFLAGLVVSVRSLDLAAAEIRWLPLAATALLAAPVTLLLSAVELAICARAVGQRMPFGAALGTTALATISNLLPGPAGAAVRGGALIAGGATLRGAGAILAVAGLLWLAMALALIGVLLAGQGWLGPASALGGTAGIVACLWAIARGGGWGVALALLGVRLAMLAAMLVRLWLIFLALGQAPGLVALLAYATAGVAGTVVGLLPGGLGVGESLAAGVAGLLGNSAAAAFLALGLNRLIGLSLCGPVAAVCWRLRR